MASRQGGNLCKSWCRGHTGQEALVRSSDNKVLTQKLESRIGETLQNEEAFEFFSEYCLAGDMSMETAGSLRDGKMVWGLAKVKESFDIGKNDE